MNAITEHEQDAVHLPEDDQQKTLGITETYLLGELIKAISRPFQDLMVPYKALHQEEQQTLMTRVSDNAREAVAQAVRCIASGDRTRFRATVEKIEFKADGVKAALSMFNSAEAHALADAAGGTVMIVIEDGARYLAVGDACEGEPDQPPLFDDSTEGSAVDTTDKPARRGKTDAA